MFDFALDHSVHARSCTGLQMCEKDRRPGQTTKRFANAEIAGALLPMYSGSPDSLVSIEMLTNQFSYDTCWFQATAAKGSDARGTYLQLGKCKIYLKGMPIEEAHSLVRDTIHAAHAIRHTAAAR